jgi:hypothetical protein
MKIAITIPTNRGFKAKTVEALCNLVYYSVEKYDLVFIMPTEGFNTAENRNLCVAKALKAGADYILFSDDDMIYPPDLLETLLERNKDIIGVLYSVRHLPRAFVIEYGDIITSDSQAIKQSDPFECNAIGTGFLLVKADVFRHIQQPHFGYKWNNNGSVKMSTDWFMLEKARDAGYKVWCEPTVINHLGEYEY